MTHSESDVVHLLRYGLQGSGYLRAVVTVHYPLSLLPTMPHIPEDRPVNDCNLLHEKWEILGLASIFFFQLKTIYILEAVF
jgi:hypothetical protein